MRDMILVERVTDGERCGYCAHPIVDSEGWNCGVFGAALKYNEHGFLRCAACLATPSAVVLTAEMIEAVNRILARRDGDGVTTSGIETDFDALRAAFPQVEGVGK